jgi:hypothetical protein
MYSGAVPQFFRLREFFFSYYLFPTHFPRPLATPLAPMWPLTQIIDFSPEYYYSARLVMAASSLNNAHLIFSNFECFIHIFY